MNKKRFNYVFIFLGLIVVYLVLFNAKINKVISPFALAFVFAVVYEYCYYGMVLVAYTISGIIYAFATNSLILQGAGLINVFACIVLLFLLTKYYKKKIPLIALFLIVLASNVSTIIINTVNGESIILCALNALLSIVFCYTNICFLRAFRSRGASSIYTLDELVGAGIFVIMLALGMYNVKLFNINLLTSFVILFVLLLGATKSTSMVMAFAILAGVGTSFASSSVVYIAIYACIAITMVLTIKTNKWFSCFMIVMVDVLLGNYFNGYTIYTIYNLLSVLLGELIFLIIPKKLINKSKQNAIGFDFSGLVYKEQTRQINNELTNISELFFNIDRVYKQMLMPSLNLTEAQKNIYLTTVKQVCEKCERYARCHKNGSDVMQNALNKSAEIALETKNLKFATMPEHLSMCEKYNVVLSYINQQAQMHLNAQRQNIQAEKTRVMIGNQLCQAGEILKILNNSLKSTTRANMATERAYKLELLYNNIDAKNVFILEQNGFFKSVVVSVNINVNKQKLVNASTNFFKISLRIADVSYSKYKGLIDVRLEICPKFGFVMGSCKCNKDGKLVCGDCYSVKNINNASYVISLCDGKGSGESASLIAEQSVSLIESYYKAGLSSELAISSVNNILASGTSENFSATDVCVLNTLDGSADFIKLGSTPTIIKTKNSISAISSNELPIGVQELTKISVTNKIICSGDIIVMSSDGVFDSFENLNDYMGYINNLNLVNMDMLAKSVLEEAVSKNGGKQIDDMSVVAIKWLSNW